MLCILYSATASLSRLILSTKMLIKTETRIRVAKMLLCERQAGEAIHNSPGA